MNHGTYSAYRKGGCRCDDCRAANIRHNKRYRLITGADRNGVPVRPISVPGHIVREHLARLRDSGWTDTALAAETGIGRNRIGDIRRGYKASRFTPGVATRILAVEPLPDLADYADPVAVDRLASDGADWQTIGATRAERIAAAERLWWYWRPIRERQAAAGTAPQYLDGPSLTDIERRFSLRAGRDFRRTPDETAPRGMHMEVAS